MSNSFLKVTLFTLLVSNISIGSEEHNKGASSSLSTAKIDYIRDPQMTWITQK